MRRRVSSTTVDEFELEHVRSEELVSLRRNFTVAMEIADQIKPDQLNRRFLPTRKLDRTTAES